MKARIKVWLRCWWIRQWIKLADRAEERLHDWQVKLREEIASSRMRTGEGTASRTAVSLSAAVPAKSDLAAVEDSGSPRLAPATRPLAAGESFLQWEARRSGVAPISKKSARRHRERVTAGAFDLRFAR